MVNTFTGSAGQSGATQVQSAPTTMKDVIRGASAIPHTGDRSIEGQVREKYGDDYWEENKGKILKIANRHGALDVAGARGPLNARARRHALRREQRSRGEDEEWQFEEGDEAEERRGDPDQREVEDESPSWWKFVAGWLLGRWNP